MEMESVFTASGPYAEIVGRDSNVSFKTAQQRFKRIQGGGGDRRQLTILLGCHRNATGRDAALDIHRRTYELVRANWIAIDALAQAIIERQTMTYEEAFAVVQPKMAAAA